MINVLDTFNAAKWFIKKNKFFNYQNLRINKLLYFSELMYYSNFNEKLLDKDFVAFDNGPVIYDVYVSYRYDNLDQYPEEEIVIDDKDILKTMNIVNFLYSDKSPNELSTITHEHNIWKEKKPLIKVNRFNRSPKIEFDSATPDLKEYYVNIFNIYKNVDFDNLVKIHIGKNTFYYFQKELQLDDNIIRELLQYPKYDDPQFIEDIIDGEIILS